MYFFPPLKIRLNQWTDLSSPALSQFPRQTFQTGGTTQLCQFRDIRPYLHVHMYQPRHPNSIRDFKLHNLSLIYWNYCSDSVLRPQPCPRLRSSSLYTMQAGHKLTKRDVPYYHQNAPIIEFVRLRLPSLYCDWNTCTCHLAPESLKLTTFGRTFLDRHQPT